MNSNEAAIGQPWKRLLPVFLCLSWVSLASAILVESDLYRYATIALLLFCGLAHRDNLALIKDDWLARLCLAWAGYALIRFIWGVAFHGERGASEWLYVFPLFIPWLGVTLYSTRQHLFAASALLITLGCIGLLATMDLPALLAGERYSPLFHHNPIHASVASGMLFISCIYWLVYATEADLLKRAPAKLIAGVAVLTACLCLVGIFAAKSKGVWLAFSITFGFMCVMALVHYSHRRMLVPGAIAALLCLVVLTSTYDNIRHYAGPTAVAALQLSQKAVNDEAIEQAMETAVDTAATPRAMRERLMLWTNSMDVFAEAPLFGSGNLWLPRWQRATYSNLNYSLLHNGYLEILVRHGILGIGALLVFVAASAHCVRRAWKRRLIPTSIMLYLSSISLFFFVTMATNSNNRLAIGESFFLLAGAAIIAISIAIRVDTQRNLQKH